MTRGEIITKWAMICKIPVHPHDIFKLVNMLEDGGYKKEAAQSKSGNTTDNSQSVPSKYHIR